LRQLIKGDVNFDTIEFTVILLFFLFSAMGHPKNFYK
jgi:hypothetical protein